MIECIFSTDTALSGDSTDALSATLLSAIKTAVEEDQSAGLELLVALDPALTEKVSFLLLVLHVTFTDYDRYDTMLSARSLMRLRSSPFLPMSKQRIWSALLHH